jgi:regulator of sirC expression with transglutaminase-like and TPR domain
LRSTPSRLRFTELLARPEQPLDLALGALLIACEEYPELDVARHVARLDELGTAARSALGHGGALADRVTALGEYLCRREGFHGNTREFYDPRNSFLNDVLDRRTGIPITLSAVFMEVGRRAGLEMQGVGFPGHFLVKVEHADGELVVDPFNGGALLSKADCQTRLDRVYGGKLRLDPDMLAPVGPRLMLFRMLRNLKAIYTRSEDHLRLLRVLDLLVLLGHGGAEDRRDRGLAYAALDCYVPAADDLEAYLSLAPAAVDATAIAARIVDLRWRAARLN